MSETNEIAARIEAMLQAYLESQGLALWGVEVLSGGGNTIVRVFIDSEAGVDVEACAEVSRHLGLLLDVEDPIEGAYTLEVSSPGINRKFFSPSQLPAYLGKKLEAELFVRREGRRRFAGELASCEGDRLCLVCEGKAEEFSWEEIKKLRLVYEFPDAGANGGKQGGS